MAASPGPNEVAQRLSELAKAFGAERGRVLRQDTRFDLREALFQLAVVPEAAAAGLLLNGFFPLFTLPF